jgi:WhiB family redox-sensing transcriptional regulator
MNGDKRPDPAPEAAERHAAELDDLAAVPNEVLADLVARNCRCVWEITHGDPPSLTGEDAPDQELAARLCAGCPALRECLELELRDAGGQTVGVWGGLSEDDRRAVYALRRTRAGRDTATQRKDDADEEGGQEARARSVRPEPSCSSAEWPRWRSQRW